MFVKRGNPDLRAISPKRRGNCLYIANRMIFREMHGVDPYGEVAQSLLKPLQPDILRLADEVTERIWEVLSDGTRAAQITERLRPDEFKQLKRRQARYLTLLMSDGLTADVHQTAAHQASVAHVLVGVDAIWIVEAYRFYESECHNFLKACVADVEVREAISHVMSQRVLRDIESQVSTTKKIAAELADAFSRIDHVMTSTGNMTDLIRGVLEAIGSLPGGISMFFARVDDSGVLQIEQSYGDAAEQYHRAMEAGTAPKFSIDPEVPAGRGPGGRAWRSGKIIISDAWLLEPDKAPWRAVGEVLGFRSSACVPVLDESGHPVGLLSLYSAWPGHFSTEGIHGLLSHVQQVLNHGVQQRIRAPVVPLREQQTYRALLAERSLVVHYQPVVDLRDGSMVKIEGLARLRDLDGELIAPRRFLPALGRDDLLMLFEQGIDQICHDLLGLLKQGIDTKIAINLPAEALEDPRYERVFFNCLEKRGLTGNRFQLEILETQDAGERIVIHKAFIERLQAAGVQIAQDDLGSGHSSLLRLDQYPFDEVKIDQGLVRGALYNPKRAVDFILYLTRLAHAFNVAVTVEGLENKGMIEAAAILGADYGQGYGIAKPMPVERLRSWRQHYQYTVNPGKPTTAIGAMAGYLLWDMQLAAVSERPELAAEFVGAKAIVEQFISANGLREGRIGRLLTHNGEVVSAPNGRPEGAALIRSQVLKELTDRWLHEVGCHV